MKTINKITNRITRVIGVVLISVFTLNSCQLEDPITSEITFFPTFEMAGEQYMIVQKGVAFNDPGVTAFAGEDEIPSTSSGVPSGDEIGLFRINYSATNADGFDGTTFRYVIVADDPSYIAENDLSGSYTRDSNSAHVMTLVKFTDGFYQADDILPTNGIAAIIAQVSNTILVIPAQSSRFGTIEADEFNHPGSSGELINETDITLQTYISCCGIFTRRFLKD